MEKIIKVIIKVIFATMIAIFALFLIALIYGYASASYQANEQNQGTDLYLYVP